LGKITVFGRALVRRGDSNCILITLEKLLTVLIFTNLLLGDGARMRKIAVLGQPPESN
jgi:hypothetical protein